MDKLRERKRAAVLLMATVATLSFAVFDKFTADEPNVYSAPQVSLPAKPPVVHRAVPTETNAGDTGELHNPFTELHETKEQAETAKTLVMQEEKPPQNVLPQRVPTSSPQNALPQPTKFSSPKTAKDAPKVDEQVPRLAGIAADENLRLAILTDGENSATSATGDYFDGWEVVFVGEDTATLKKSGRVIELRIAP